MDQQVNHFHWWEQALKGIEQPIHENTPQCGFYRKKSKSGELEPAAIWLGEDGKFNAEVGGKTVDAFEIWTWVCQKPITHDEYSKFKETGTWSDVDEGIAPPPAGHNQGPEDVLESLKVQIENAKGNLADFETITDDTTAKRAVSARNRLNELSRECDNIRTEAKAPHLKAGKEVDAKWQPLVKDAKEVADSIRKSLSAFETKKAHEAARKEREAAAKREEAEAKRLEEAKTAEANGETVPEPEPAPEPVQEAAPIQTQIKGGHGKAATIRIKKVATVVDQDKAYHAFKKHSDLIEVIRNLAQRAVNDGHEIDGVKITEERDVR